MGHSFYIAPQEYERAANYGVSTATLNYRVQYAGWDKERAITTPPKRFTDRSKWIALAAKNNIPDKVFRNRLCLGWSPFQAATTPLLTPDNKRSRLKSNNPAKRKYDQKLIALAESNGVSYNTFLKRVSKGWSPELAASEPIVSTKERGQRGIKALRLQRGDINALIFK
jgi:hypothetical protein